MRRVRARGSLDSSRNHLEDKETESFRNQIQDWKAGHVTSSHGFLHFFTMTPKPTNRKEKNLVLLTSLGFPAIVHH
jgi:hypothetical protein